MISLDVILFEGYTKQITSLDAIIAEFDKQMDEIVNSCKSGTFIIDNTLQTNLSNLVSLGINRHMTLSQKRWIIKKRDKIRTTLIKNILETRLL